ncbi:MAG: S1C family serine protease [Candidatus Omnitrophota bacterium]|jgi:S1-C subfamily serine protease
MRRSKKNKFIRYLKILKKGLRRINRKKALSWLNKNLEGHPFILGLFFLFWVNYMTRVIFERPEVAQLIKTHLRVHSLLFFFWFLLVILSNSLKDKEKVKWYLKKRFIVFMLLLITPVGLILLWAGSKFKRRTKIVLTAVFISFFIVSTIYQEKRYQSFARMSPFDRVTSILNRQKRKVYLKTLARDEFKKLRLETSSRKKREKLAVSDMYSIYTPSIATIQIKDKQGQDMGQASGFVISDDGFIATNFHVVNSAYQAEVKIGEDIFNEAYLAAYNPDMDIAVLKVDAKGLSPLIIGDSDELISGQFIITLGNPLGFEKSVSSGIVSAIRSSPSLKLIQMTVPVSPGSSGCPVLNEYGEVVGIATIASFFIAQNLNFAVPINYLKEMVKED